MPANCTAKCNETIYSMLLSACFKNSKLEVIFYDKK